MRRIGSIVGLAVLCMTLPAPGVAQLPAASDHLQCYKVKDTQAKASFTATLSGVVVEAGCRIKVPAKLACVPATKSGVNPTPPGGGGAGVTNGFACYKVKCPKTPLPAIPLNDQFGNRAAAGKKAKLVCAPVATCEDAAFPVCGGTCAQGELCVPVDLVGCECVAPPTCGGMAPECSGNCPAGLTCGRSASGDFCSCLVGVGG